MGNKVSKQRSKKGSLLLVVITAAITTALSYAYFNRQFQRNKAQMPQDFDKIVQLYARIQKDYVGQVSDATLIDGALKGMTAAIGDPYSVYLEKEDAKNLDDSLASSVTGIGATMTMVDGKAQVAALPSNETPAAKAGIKQGDILLSVDKKDLKNLSLDEIVALVRGKEGTTVHLQFLRGKETLDFDVKREKVAIESISTKMVAPDTGYLKIQTFSENTAEEFKEKSLLLKKQGAKKYVIDVRQNPGGFLEQVVAVGSMLLKNDQTILKWKDKKGKQYESKANNVEGLNYKLTEPVAILVDNSSASASEILAGAIKDNSRGKVIGTKTYGKGTMQDVDSGKKEKLKLTTGKWYTPNGTSVNGSGLTPDIFVDYPDYVYLPPLNTKLTYHLGDENELISGIKMLLRGLGYQLDKSNLFDEALFNSIKDYQEKNHLPVTGVWEENTSTLLQNQLYREMKNHDPFVEKALSILGSQHE